MRKNNRAEEKKSPSKEVSSERKLESNIENSEKANN